MRTKYLHHIHPAPPFPHILLPLIGTNPQETGPVLLSCSPIL
jgi:hypothetical protein